MTESNNRDHLRQEYANRINRVIDYIEQNIDKSLTLEELAAVANFELSAPEEYQDAWFALCGGWLPESGYQPDDRPSFELYLNDSNKHPEGKHIVDIYLPDVICRPFGALYIRLA